MSYKNYIILIFLIFLHCLNSSSDNNKTREDGAVRLTFSSKNASCQNPAFSPDGKYILFTRFLKGYNNGPSELVKINITTLKEEIIVSADDADNVNVPGPCWVDGKICWASDRAGESDEIYVANEDGTNIKQITEHPEAEGYYIEPVFNPDNTDKIIFEYALSDNTPHRIAIVELDKENRVCFLTDGTDYDDRLPNWAFDDSNNILFQRATAGKDDWQIYTAKIVFTDSVPFLKDLHRIDQPASHNTDNSWYINNNYIISSSDYNIEIPNIYAFPVNQSDIVRITFSEDYEDGAPCCSRDGKHIAFESHRGQEEDYPSDIWMIKTPDELYKSEE